MLTLVLTRQWRADILEPATFQHWDGILVRQRLTNDRTRELEVRVHWRVEQRSGPPEL